MMWTDISVPILGGLLLVVAVCKPAGIRPGYETVARIIRIAFGVCLVAILLYGFQSGWSIAAIHRPVVVLPIWLCSIALLAVRSEHADATARATPRRAAVPVVPHRIPAARGSDH